MREARRVRCGHARHVGGTVEGHAVRKGICYVCIPPVGDAEARFRVARVSGFEGVELTFSEPGAGPLTLESTESEVRRLAASASGIGIELPSVMAGAALRATPILHPDAAVRDQAARNLELALERARWLGAGAVLVHPGQLRENTRYDDAYTWTRDVLGSLRDAADRADVDLLIENVWNKFLLSPLEMRALVDSIDHPRIGVYFDVGNIVLFGYPEQWIEILGRRIKRVHVKDFKRAVGSASGFCQLLDGDANYPAVMRALRATGYDGYLTSEVSERELPEGQSMRDVALRIEQIMAM